MKTTWLYLLLIILLHSLIVIPSIFMITHADTWIAEAWDSKTGHIALINYFIQHPYNFLSYPNNLVSTTPGYHLLLSKIALLFQLHSINENTWTIRLFNTIPGYLLLMVAWSIVWKLKSDIKLTFSLVLPIAFSYYLLSSSIWINTDNIAELFYALLILIFLTNKSSILGGLTAFFMVFSRQVYLPVIISFWPIAVFPKLQPRLLKFAISTTLFSLFIFLLYALKWKGLTPVGTQHWNKFVGVNPSCLLQALSLAGLIGIPYLFLFFSDIKNYRNKFLFITFLSGMISFIVWSMASTTLNENLGRIGSVIWRIGSIPSYYGEHSIIVLILCFVGVIVLLNNLFHAIRYQYYPIETMMLLCYFMSYSAQIFSFQRYVEVPILITYAIFGARIKNTAKWSLMGPIALASIFSILSMAHFWHKI